MKFRPRFDRTQSAGLLRQLRSTISLGLAIAIACSVAEAAEDPPPASESLETIVVKSEKLQVETLIDRKVYTVSSDAQSTFGTLSDILSVIPSVDVDPDGIVSLRGDTKVLILIDGKPSAQFAGAAAGDNVQSFPAQDIERIEINEAFAAIPIAVAHELGLPEDIINIEGGAIAHGHPIGATGAILTTRLLHSMRRDGLRRGMVTLCIGGGQGAAFVLERA